MLYINRSECGQCIHNINYVILDRDYVTAQYVMILIVHYVAATFSEVTGTEN